MQLGGYFVIIGRLFPIYYWITLLTYGIIGLKDME